MKILSSTQWRPDVGCPNSIFVEFKKQQHPSTTDHVFTIRNSYWKTHPKFQGEPQQQATGTSFWSWKTLAIGTGILLAAAAAWFLFKRTDLYKKAAKLKQLADVGERVVDLGSKVANQVKSVKSKVGTVTSTAKSWLGKAGRFLRLDKITSLFRRPG